MISYILKYLILEMIDWQHMKFECNVFPYLFIQYLSTEQIHLFIWAPQ